MLGPVIDRETELLKIYRLHLGHNANQNAVGGQGVSPT